jgi:hypothetical protein
LTSFLLAKLVPEIIWVKVEKPTFDLVGVVLGSLSLAGILVAAAALLGSVFGLVLIFRARPQAHVTDPVSLHLDAASPQA